MKTSKLLLTVLIAAPLTLPVAFAERQGHDPYANDVLNPYSSTLKVVDYSQLNKKAGLRCPTVNDRSIRAY